ncbi:MAG: hypothetical protein WBO29_08025 [Albidovulum sp.]
MRKISFFGELLKRHFDPEKALNIRIFLFRWGALLWLGPFAIVVLALSFYLSNRDHELDGFVLGDVQFAADFSSETGARYTIVVKMPDNSVVTLSTRDLSLASSAIDKACVEVRRFSDNGNRRLRLAPMRECQ